MPLTSDSLVARAFRDRVLVVAHAVEADGTSVSGEMVARAAAVPVLADERAIGVAYLEHPADRSDADVAVFTKLAEVLTERVNHRLQRAPSIDRVPPDRWLGPAADANAPPAENESSRYVLARQVRRVPIHDGVTVLVNGVASALVDLSTLGAQVVSPNAVYPNRSVRIVLPRDEGDLSCKARIVGARVERQQDDADAVRYRAGLEFTEADKTAVQSFVSRMAWSSWPLRRPRCTEGVGQHARAATARSSAGIQRVMAGRFSGSAPFSRNHHSDIARAALSPSCGHWRLGPKNPG